MKRLTVGYLLATTLLSTAACGISDDEIWMPPGADGKADGFTLIKGSDIPSQYVSANKYYMIARSIDNLTKVGALDQAQTDLAKRVDGIIANMPANGAMHLAELVRMEDPSIYGSLFPAEKTALPKLWKLAEAPDGNTLVAGQRDSFGAVDSSLPPAAAVPPANLTISTLATPELQAAATRLQNVYNSDNSAATVTLADLAQGVANPASFTPAEVTAFGTIQAVFREKAVAQSTNDLVLSPGPGSFTKDETLGPVKLHIASTTKIDEDRTVYSTQMTISMSATQTIATTADMPQDAFALALNYGGSEAVFTAGAVPSIGAGDFIFEVWENGQRTFATNADMPITTSTETIQLTDKLDYKLMSGLAPLVRNLTAATATHNSSYYTFNTHYTYDKAVVPPPAMAAQPAITATETPTVTIPVGRYSFPQQQSTFYVYPNNVLWFSRGNQMIRLVPQGNNGTKPTRFIGIGNTGLTFDAATNQLTYNQQPYVNARLDGSMRDI